MHPRYHNLASTTLPKGLHNSISDVAGITVGHCTVDTETHKTGVTVVMPCAENPFYHKLPAGVFVLNGFGKTAGLMQIQELGTIETPIALTNTLNVGLVHDAMVGYMLERCAADGGEVHSVNPIVCECCDALLSDIAHRVVGEREVRAAIADARADFAQGGVGAGTGTICHGLKGGIGSASRVMNIGGRAYTLGVLVQTNHGTLADLTIGGVNVGRTIPPEAACRASDKGSVIAILATDLPLDSRQLARVARRVTVGISRLGSYIGQGSGEIFIGFSTANAFDPRVEEPVRPTISFNENLLDLPFRAAAECAEEAVLNSMLYARAVETRDRRANALTDVWVP